MRLLLIIIGVVFITSCQQGSDSQEKNTDSEVTAELQEDVLNIGKMHCEMCAASIEKGLGSVEGVEFVKVNLDDSTAVVRYDGSKTNVDRFEEVIVKRGYILKDNNIQP